jgi:hypothetical protein
LTLRRNRPILALVALAALLLPALAACDSAPPSPTPQPLASGGLGLTRAEWERKHNFILSIPGSDYIYDSFNPPLFGYRVNFWQEGANDPGARISAMAVDTRLVLSDTGKIPPAAAGTAALSNAQMQQAVHALLPADAERQGTEHPNATGTFTETYISNLIKNVYPPLSAQKDPWGSRPPGTIRVVYEQGGPDVLITAGNGAQSTGSPLEILPTKTPGS